MKLTIDPRDIPQYTDEKTEPIELPGGLVLRLGMEYDQDSSPEDWMGKIVWDRSPDTLWEELLEAIENDVLEPFQAHHDYGHTVETDDFGFTEANYKEPPGIHIDSGGRDGWGRDSHRWLAPSDRHDGVPDEERRKYNKMDARTFYGWLHDDWCFVGLTADIHFDGVEVGSASIWGVECGLGDGSYHRELFKELAEEAWLSAKAEVLKLGMRLEELKSIPELNEDLEVDYGSDAS